MINPLPGSAASQIAHPAVPAIGRGGLEAFFPLFQQKGKVAGLSQIADRSILPCRGGKSPREHEAILILHFLVKKSQGLPSLTGQWISFKEMDGGLAYYDAFKKRAVDPLLAKYGRDINGFMEACGKFKAKHIEIADAGFILEAFEKVPVMITLWGSDAEFDAEANMLFDQSIKRIFATEDIAVLGGIIAKEV